MYYCSNAFPRHSLVILKLHIRLVRYLVLQMKLSSRLFPEKSGLPQSRSETSPRRPAPFIAPSIISQLLLVSLTHLAAQTVCGE